MEIRNEELTARKRWEFLNPGYSLEKSESPDWIDSHKGIGLEVTTATLQHIREQESFVEKHLNEEITPAMKKSIQKMEKNDCVIVAEKTDDDGNKAGKIYGFGCFFGREGVKNIFSSIFSKYKKQYQQLNRLELYVFAELISADSLTEEDFLEVFRCTEKLNKNIFETIYIDFGNRIIAFDMNKRMYEDKQFAFS